MSDPASKPSRYFEERSFGHGARFQVTPECNQQLASQGHNPDLAQTGVALAKARLIPLTKLAFGLVPQPAPGNLIFDMGFIFGIQTHIVQSFSHQRSLAKASRGRDQG